MEPRKIIKFGNSSHVITIPQEWLELNNLKKGDSLNVIEKPESLLVTLQTEKKEKKAKISIDNKPLKLFNKELLSYYLKNYRIIEIYGHEIHERLDEITRFKEKISSVEITEIAKEKIVLRDLTSPQELDLHQLIKEIVDMQNLFFEKLCQENVKDQ
jgi:phosphate uptake regulator